MSGIVLSSSVRQNLLSLQSTADLLATTQNRLATGKKVNSALDKGAGIIQSQITAINDEESSLKNMQAGAIQRLTPKLETLATLSKKAREIIQWGAAKKGRN